MSLSVYLAARFSRLPELLAHKHELEAQGITVTSRWLLGGHEWVGTPDDEIPVEVQATFASQDREDIERADVLVFFGDSPSSYGARGGACVEMGIAIGQGKAVIVVGARQNVFCCLPEVTFVPDWEHALQLLVGVGVPA